MIDAIDQLISLYKSRDDFVKAFVEATLFLPPEVVQTRNEEMIDLYKSEGKFPIRYSPAYRKIWGVKNKDEAVTFTRNNDARLPEYPAFNVTVDLDGNHENRRQIRDKLNHRVSAGKNSTVKNYTISHVWGLASHPLFFSALWNIVLIPTHFNYLMDKDPESHEVVGAVKEAIERRCTLLYQPYETLFPHIPEMREFKSLFPDVAASRAEAVYRTHFLTEEGITREPQPIVVSDDGRELIEKLLRKMGKKFFVDYYEAYASGTDLMNVIPTGLYTFNSTMTRVSTMRKIFREGLNAKALAIIVDNPSSRLDDETVERARALLELL
jgi:hypothetical protein